MSEDAHTLAAESKRLNWLDSSNQFFVGVNGRDVVQVLGVSPHVTMHFTREQALNLAAWLSVLADPAGKDFARLVEEIKKT